MLERLEKLLAGYTIQNLTMYMVVLTGVVSAGSIAFQSDLGILTLSRLVAGEWWHLFFFPFRIVSGGFLGPYTGLVFYLYMFWLFGSSVEEDMGATRYNIFIFSSIFFVTLGSLLFPIQVHANFIYLSIFFAVAYRAPDMEILLMFILPVKMKWLALFLGISIFLGPVSDALEFLSIWPLFAPLFGCASFLWFYGPEMVRNYRTSASSQQRKARMEAATVNVHRCTICDRTENSDPELDFRFCVDCDDHEYCMEHLKQHEHRREAV